MITANAVIRRGAVFVRDGFTVVGQIGPQYVVGLDAEFAISLAVGTRVRLKSLKD